MLVFLVPLIMIVAIFAVFPWAMAPSPGQAGTSGFMAGCVPCPSPPGGCYNAISDCLDVVVSASVTSGTVPLSVSFSEKLYNGLGGYSYAWTFGDGGTSTAASPSHTYSTAGTYYPSVKVTESGGHYSTGDTEIVASCKTTSLAGAVEITGTSTGIYGAEVVLGLGQTTYTSSTGSYSFSLGCSTTASSTLQVSAPGYVATGSTAVSWTVGASDTLSTVFLSLVSTDLTESQSEWYNVTNCLATGCATLSPSTYSDLNVTGVSVGYLSSCSACSISNIPSGDPTSQVIVLQGTDASNALTSAAHPQDAYLQETIMTIPGSEGFPLSAPMLLAFNVYVQQAGCMACGTPYDLENFTVDLEFTDGTMLSTVVDDTGSPIVDGNGTQIGYDWWEMQPGNWVRMEFDLSELRDKSVRSVLLDYNNHGGGGCGNTQSVCSGKFIVAFDNIRLEMPHYSTTIADGGFELPSFDGWSVAGDLAPQLESSVIQQGSQSALLGNTTCPTTVGLHGSCSTYYTILIQALRIPNNLPGLSIDFYVQLGNNGGSSDFQRIWLNDRTTLTSDYLLGSASSGPLTTSGAWQSYSVSVTSLEGHVVWFEAEVAHNTASTQGDWMYLDSVYLVPTGVTVIESAYPTSSSSNSATSGIDNAVDLPASTYLASSGSGFQQTLPMGFGSGLRHSPGCVASGGCTGADVLALGVDFSSQAPSWDYCVGTCGNDDVLNLDLSTFASTSVEIPTTAGPVPVAISQLTMSVALYFSGTSVTGPTLSALGGIEQVENLQPGYPVTQTHPPSDWDLVIGGIEVALPFLLPGIGVAADIGIDALTAATIEAGTSAGLHGLQWAIDGSAVTTGVSGVAGGCTGSSCSMSWASASSSGPQEGGATALIQAEADPAGSGTFLVEVSTTAYFDWQGNSFDTLTTYYYLNVEV